MERVSAVAKTINAGEFLKYDEEHGLVFGYAIVCTEKGERYFDQHGDHITFDGMLKATSDFMSSARTSGEMHEKVYFVDAAGNRTAVTKADGLVMYSLPVNESIAKALGWTGVEKAGWVIAMKPSAEVLAKCKAGQYTGFSIGGSYGTEPGDTVLLEEAS